MKKIVGDAKTIRQLLSGTKYSVDYYQREYKWETKHVSELIDDLTSQFYESYDPNHERAEIDKYGHYFLGSIIVSDKDGQKFIIDGQQRLTTITLILIYLYNRLTDPEDKREVAELIFSKRLGKRSFNIDVPDRTACMEALYKGEILDETGKTEAVRNMIGRYHDIQELYPEDLIGNALPFFVDWLMEKVYLVEITALSDKDAYTIFETMNDRGLSLSPVDMLKGYLLANINDEDLRLKASKVWLSRMQDLMNLAKDEDADCIKAWLRSQYANSIRERKKGALPLDFDLIGTEFHRWIRDNNESLKLNKSGDFVNFIQKDMDFYARQYLMLRESSRRITKGLEEVFYNAQSNFTLQYPLILAPLNPSDREDVIKRKIRVVGSYLDILIARRTWNFRAIDYSTMQYAMFLVMRDIRGKSPKDLVKILSKKLEGEEETFTSNANFRLHGQNGRQIHQILARLTDFIETGSKIQSRYSEYIVRSGKNGYEIEHIWADHPERFSKEFSHPEDFHEYRNRIGGLLLLPKSFNASYGDLPYEKKLPHYYGQNLLAKSLYPKCYDRNPSFRQFVSTSSLPFTAHKQFQRTDLDARQELYQKIAEQIWNPERLERGATE